MTPAKIKGLRSLIIGLLYPVLAVLLFLLAIWLAPDSVDAAKSIAMALVAGGAGGFGLGKIGEGMAKGKGD
jgi:uncharacterized membrane protein (GlpM family)